MKEHQEKRLIYQVMDMSERAIFVLYMDDFSILYANAKAKEIFGDNIIGLTCYEVVEEKNCLCMDCPFQNLENGQQCICERYYKNVDLHVQIKADAFMWDNGKKVLMCVIQDSDLLAQAKQAQKRLQNKEYKEKIRSSDELYQTIADQLKTIVFEYNYEMKTSYTSPLFEDKFGVLEMESINFLNASNTKSIIYEEDIPTYELLFKNRKDDFREVTCRLKEISGRIVWYRICIQFIKDSQGKVERVIGTLRDVDDLIQSREILRYRSEYDVLTGLYNSNRFYIDAGNAIRENEGSYAIISLDIDRFKMINDLFGMKVGDDVLCHVADVLRQKLPVDSYCCRIHSDVFFLCVKYENKGYIIKLVEKIRKAIFRNEYSFDVNTKFGVYLMQDIEVPVNLMCDRATLAARTVKNNAMKFCAFYDEQYRTNILKASEIEKDMNIAISDKQFVMYLQPKYLLENGEICGAEVLARWKHPVKGLIQPNDFIPLFEQNGFILKLDEYMWEEACQTLERWKKEGKKTVPLSVNISRYHIKNNNLIRVWKKLLSKYEIEPSDVTLEITETFFYDSMELYEVLQKLQDMGFKLEVDDFGAGYSSLNMIRHVPINTIKIDRNFLDKKLATEKGKIVIRHTIAMAKDLNLAVIAEGVETKEHVEFLKNTACDIAQGYYFARPMPLEEFNELCYGKSSIL